MSAAASTTPTPRRPWGRGVSEAVKDVGQRVEGEHGSARESTQDEDRGANKDWIARTTARSPTSEADKPAATPAPTGGTVPTPAGKVGS